jgi:hypothetical protein
LRRACLHRPIEAEAAYAWLCRRRRDWGANVDVEFLRARWPLEREEQHRTEQKSAGLDIETGAWRAAYPSSRA